MTTDTDLRIEIRSLIAGSAGIPARLSAKARNRWDFNLKAERKRETRSVLAARLRAGMPALPATGGLLPTRKSI